MKNKVKGKYGEFGDYGIKYLRNHDAGSGPYMVLEHRHGIYLKMKRFKEYSLKEWKPNSIDIVTIPIIPEAVTRVTKFKVGELDLGEWIWPAKSLKELQKDKNFVTSVEPTDGIWYCCMNNKRPPLDDPFVRKACAHAWDAETVMNVILVGGKRSFGPLPVRLQGGCSNIAGYDFDLDKARTLLKKSKYSAEELKQFELEMPGGMSQRYDRVYLLFNSNLKKIGLNPKIVSSTWPDMCKHQQNPETAFHFALITHVAQVPHPFEYLMYHTKDGWGRGYPPGGMYYHNPKVTEAIEMASDSADIEEQRKYYCIAQRQIAEDCPAVYSHTDLRYMPYWRYVKGYTFPIGSEFFHLRFDLLTMDTDDPLFKKNHGW